MNMNEFPTLTNNYHKNKIIEYLVGVIADDSVDILELTLTRDVGEVEISSVKSHVPSKEFVIIIKGRDRK